MPECQNKNIYFRCVTCELVTSRGEQCARSSVSMNPGTSHYVHTCLGQVTRHTCIYYLGMYLGNTGVRAAEDE